MQKKYRYIIMIMLTFITIINYIDRGAIAYAQQFIIEEYGLNPKTWGEVLGFFGYGYIFGGLFGGILADKKGPKFVWIISATFWSLFELSMGYAGDIGLAAFGGSALIGFAVFRILFGLSEGPSFAVLSRSVANWAAPKEKAILSSVGLTGVPIGALITAPLAVFLISAYGWRMMFIILGVIGFVWAILWAKIFTDLPENHPRVSKEELAEIRSSQGLLKTETSLEESMNANTPWYYYFKNPTLLFNTIGYFTFQYVNFLILTWTPKYLQDVYHFKLSSLWYLGMIPWIGACITLPLGAKISDALRQRTGNLRIARSLFVAVSFFFTALCFILIPMMSSLTGVLTLMCLGTALAFLPSSMFWVIILDTEPSRAGSYGGVTHFFTNISSIVAPTLTGVLVMKYGYTSMFVSAAIAAIVGVVAMVFVNPGKKVDVNSTAKAIEQSVTS